MDNMKLAKVIRVSDVSTKCEYEPMMLDVNKNNIVEKFGRCEFGEIIYVEVENELLLELYYDSQYNEYFKRESQNER